MKSFLKIMTSLALLVIANFTFAVELETISVTNKIIEKKEVVKQEIQKEVQEKKEELFSLPNCPASVVIESCQEQEMKIKIKEEEGNCLLEKCVPIKNQQEEMDKELIKNIVAANNEKERKEIFQEFLKQKEDKKLETKKNILVEKEESKVKKEIIKTNDIQKEDIKENIEKTKSLQTLQVKEESLISKKSNEIFSKFDLIIKKLKKINSVINSKVSLFRESNLNTSVIEINLKSVNDNLSLVENKKAEAWILMQKTVELENKDLARDNLDSVKILLKSLKDDIKQVSGEIKEIIQQMKVMLK